MYNNNITCRGDLSTECLLNTEDYQKYIVREDYDNFLKNMCRKNKDYPYKLYLNNESCESDKDSIGYVCDLLNPLITNNLNSTKLEFIKSKTDRDIKSIIESNLKKLKIIPISEIRIIIDFLEYDQPTITPITNDIVLKIFMKKLIEKVLSINFDQDPHYSIIKAFILNNNLLIK